ncbi:MAG: NAD(P)/FAD-dependent oxidoreductase [Vulcanimicrobiaceae bacterium]
MSSAPGPTRARILIVGTGFAGLGMAIRLKRAGIDDFIILERARDVGGTWRENAYPGCACDVPSELYSFSFERHTRWSRVYPTQPEIQAYLAACASRNGLERHIRFERDVTEARFDERTATWTVATRAGEAFVAPILISGMGGLSNPAFPDVPGLETFTGPSFHSSQWDHAADLADKRVAVIGTGASAVQFVPHVAPHVRKLTIFQRSPPWILPKADGPVGARKRRLLRVVPGLAAASRAAMFGLLEIRAVAFTRAPKLLRFGERFARAHLARAIADPELRAKVTPDYRMGCKRILISNDYYPALVRANVDVVTDDVERVEPDAIVTRGGVRHPVDAIVYGTGFRAQDGLAPVRVIGTAGRVLADVWRDGMSAYLGTSVAGFPNFFLLVGPNTGLGHNSMVYMIESQINYVLDALRVLQRRRARSFDVLPAVQAAFNAMLERRMAKTVWQTGCRSWYLDRNGRNTALWPGFTFDFRRRTRRIDARRYRWDAQAPEGS